MSVLSRYALRLLQCSLIALLGCSGLACRAETPTGKEASSSPAGGYVGTWVMKLGQRVFIVLTIEPSGDAFAARIQAPSSFSLPMDGGPRRYTDIKLPIHERKSLRAFVEGDHLRLVIDDPAAPGEPDEYNMSLADANHAVLRYAEMEMLAAFPFERNTGPAPVPANDWEQGRTYAADAEVTTPNAEMARIYDEDQAVRQKPPTTVEGWVPIAKADKAHRAEVTAMLESGALHTADDFRKAAFVFQHGDRSDDYLLAHTLALVAIAKGDSGASWIAAASLDRFLQSIRQPQIYGTQFLGYGKGASQGTYNEKLISDLLRTELGVPTIAAQALQLKDAQSAGAER